MRQHLLIVLFVVILTVGGLIIFQRSTRSDFNLPSGPATEETILVEENDAVADGLTATSGLVDAAEAKSANQKIAPRRPAAIAKKIMVTKGVRHSVPLKEIIDVLGKDNIPAINDPHFVSAAPASEWLGDEELGLAVDFKDERRFYPFQILVWHEIVNDTIAGQRVLVTYCPLCLSGIVFDPLVKGMRVEFGTSGKLWNSNLVMYDRKTNSLWSQVLGEAIVGEMTGTKLKILPSDIMRFGVWKSAYPEGQVLSRDTGEDRTYGVDPYGNYYTSPGVLFPLTKQDTRLPEKELVLGVVMGGKAKAYSTTAVKRKGEITDVFAGLTIVARYEASADVVRLYKKKPTGGLERLNPIAAFWFSWAAAHPATELYK